ncbi:MAG: hypothetical protein NTV63_00245 [Candidatus Woesearchaeota archaeon]|nr:hypothetical protein [Candidatus Woesearchaeota archaeon]
MPEETLESIVKIFDKAKIEGLQGNLDANIMYAVINLEARKEQIPEEFLPAPYALTADKLQDYNGTLADEVIEYYTTLYRTRINEKSDNL